MEGVDAKRVPVVAATEARVAVTGDMVLGDTEDLAYLHSGPYRITGPVMSFLEDPEKASGRGLHPPVDECSAAVPPVAAHRSAAVEFDQVALREARVALGVDAYAHARADRGKDPVVRVILVAGIFHRGLRDAHDVAVAHVRRVHPRLEILDHKAHPRLGELRSQPEPLDLEGVLYAPELVHVVRKVY